MKGKIMQSSHVLRFAKIDFALRASVVELLFNQYLVLVYAGDKGD